MSTELCHDRRALLLSGPQHYDDKRPTTDGIRGFLEHADPLGIAVVSTILKKYNFETHWAEMEPNEVTNLSRLIASFPLIAISSRHYDISLAREVVAVANKSGKTTLVGGYGPTFSPDCFDNATVVVEGECETVLPTVIDDLLSGRVKHVYDSRGLSPLNLKQDYVWPDRAIFPKPQGTFGHLKKHSQEWQRGCSNFCTFCSPVRLQRVELKDGERQVRVREIEDIKKEIERGMKLGRGDRLFSVDLNSSAISIDEQRELYQWLKEKGIKWYTEGTVAPLIKDFELKGYDDCLLKLMSPLGEGGGCYSFLYGADDLTVQKVGGSSDKEINLIQRAKLIFKKFGIPLNLSVVIGLDKHTYPDTFYRYASILGEVRVPYAFIHLATPYPGTVWGDKVEREGRIIDRETLHYNHRMAISEPGAMTMGELQQGYYWLLRYLNSISGLSETVEDNLNLKIAVVNPELALILSGIPWRVETYLTVLELTARGHIDIKKQKEMDGGYKAWKSRS